MIRTGLRNLTLLAAAVLLAMIAFGGFGDDGDDGDGRPDSEQWRTLSLEIGMADNDRDSIQVAVAAQLGSAGNYSARSERIWHEAKFPNKAWTHRFRAKVGERVSAEVANPGPAVGNLSCHFYQQDVDEAKYARDGARKDFGDITTVYGNDVAGILARCAATVL